MCLEAVSLRARSVVFTESGSVREGLAVLTILAGCVLGAFGITSVVACVSPRDVCHIVGGIDLEGRIVVGDGVGKLILSNEDAATVVIKAG